MSQVVDTNNDSNDEIELKNDSPTKNMDKIIAEKFTDEFRVLDTIKREIADEEGKSLEGDQFKTRATMGYSQTPDLENIPGEMRASMPNNLNPRLIDG